MRLQSQMMMQTMNMRHVAATELEYDFEVFLRDGTKIEVTSAMYTDSVTKRHFIVLIDKKYKKSDTNRYKKIYPIQTLYIQRNLAMNGPGLIHNNIKPPPPVYYKGAANDSCWMFKVISGAINAYSFSGQEDGTYFNETSIVAIQLNNGPILNFNEENLKLMVASDINALEAIGKKNYYKAIKRYNKDIEKASKK
ncbi:hypothetical protein [uncultured Mucilaginibacter sp.]|uniref:hypothetical protein n=1 Tax=uncultured Mucilaginibacter sp. TaxID=797541 RepID=UPI0025FF22F2|nr:hypothetical protein [uncultured Mucilaginibacter sp.]